MKQITKDEFIRLGGLKNPQLYRRKYNKDKPYRQFRYYKADDAVNFSAPNYQI